MRDLIVLIHNGAPSDRHAVLVTRRSFAALGYRLDDVSLADPNASAKLENLLRNHRDELFFFLSSNFWALNIQQDDRLLHQFSGIPLVIYLHDHPVYFLPLISPALDNAIIFTLDDYVSDYVQKYYPANVQTIPNVGWVPDFDDGPPAFDQFVSRKNVLLCPMNLMISGLNLDDTWYIIKQLPLARRERAVRLVESALTDCITPLHVLSERRAASGDEEFAIEDLRHVLNFVKLWRRNFLVRTIVDLPVLISSQYVPADLEFRYPAKFRLLTVQETLPLYAEHRFTVNTAVLTHCPHDRVTDALFRNSVCITDANAFITSHFRDEENMIFFDFASNTMRDKIGRYIDDSEKAYALTVNAYEVRKNIFSFDSFQNLVNAVARRWNEDQTGGKNHNFAHSAPGSSP